MAGGSFNCAGAAHSLAAGYRAKVRPPTDPGTGACASLGSYPGGDGDQGTFVWADSQPASLPSTGPNQFLVRASGGIWFGSNSLALIPAGRFLNTSTGGYLSSAGVWTDSSSRAVKTDFEVIDPGSVLGRVLALPIREWSYRAAPDVRHVGPVAEDFHAAFGLGEGDTHLASLDTAGVALAAIQGLNAKLEAENAALREELVALRSLVESRLNAEH
ncbi:MAG: tail fiber domain-containing protein [Xanthomonadales bacterium]|nr:tail fiber domain-containing protein [Xanthomonadales bacterium]